MCIDEIGYNDVDHEKTRAVEKFCKEQNYNFGFERPLVLKLSGNIYLPGLMKTIGTYGTKDDPNKIMIYEENLPTEEDMEAWDEQGSDEEYRDTRKTSPPHWCKKCHYQFAVKSATGDNPKYCVECGHNEVEPSC